MNKVVVSSDSGTILPEMARKYGFSMIPVPIIINGKTYLDTEIDMDELYALLDSKENLPKTSTANIAEFAEFFSQMIFNGRMTIFLLMADSKFAFLVQCNNML